ncbi:MAG: hypothetical protein LIP23_10510, partial [Planctomycetes bacterium]|nr:hypothetical protein [Planctomycetota bacterium]
MADNCRIRQVPLPAEQSFSASATLVPALLVCIVFLGSWLSSGAKGYAGDAAAFPATTPMPSPDDKPLLVVSVPVPAQLAEALQHNRVLQMFHVRQGDFSGSIGGAGVAV